jgi:hypothetical protein
MDHVAGIFRGLTVFVRYSALPRAMHALSGEAMRLVASVMLGVALITPDHDRAREIDSERSAITIQVDKTEWLSTFGD